MGILMPAGSIVAGGNAPLVQNVVADASNSSTANIPFASPYAGTWKSTLGVNSIQVTFKASQNCTVYVDQSPNASAVVTTDSFEYNATTGNFGTTVQAVSAYYRVRVANKNATTATSVRLDSFLCPIADPMPRALDYQGNMRVGLRSMQDFLGNKGITSPAGDLNVSQPYRLCGTTFGAVGAPDASFWSATASGTGATSTISTATVVTLTSPNSGSGYAQIQSLRTGRFLNLNAHRVRTRVRIPTLAVAGSARYWGAYTYGVTPAIANGFVFSIDAAGALTLSCYNGGSSAGFSVASGSFNGEVSQYVIDANVHTYEIIFSQGRAIFIVDNVLLHTFTPTTAPMTGVLDLPVTASCTGTGTVATLELWAGAIYRLGRDVTSPFWKYIHGANGAGAPLKSGPGRLRYVILNAGKTNGTISIYDAASATNPIALIVFPRDMDPTSIEYNLNFYTGLYVVTVGGDTDATFVIE